MDQFLSEVRRDNRSNVVGATAVMNIWFLEESGDTSEDALEWETGFIEETVNNIDEERPEGVRVFGLAERSYDDEIMFVVYSNMVILLLGFGLLFLYMVLVLGNLNWIEQRALLSIAGMVVIALSLGSCYGLGFFFGVSFNDMCPVIPFLLLGIGVDDMFIILQCLDNLDHLEGESNEERVAKAMRHAGVSILVTSFTDAVTFFIGSTSVKIN